VVVRKVHPVNVQTTPTIKFRCKNRLFIELLNKSFFDLVENQSKEALKSFILL
jgi:hypothetical protein